MGGAQEWSCDLSCDGSCDCHMALSLSLSVQVVAWISFCMILVDSQRMSLVTTLARSPTG